MSTFSGSSRNAISLNGLTQIVDSDLFFSLKGDGVNITGSPEDRFDNTQDVTLGLASTISANLTGTASRASTVAVDNDTTSNLFSLFFGTYGAGEFRGVLNNSGLTYQPSTGTLTANNFAGSLTGNADSSTLSISSTSYAFTFLVRTPLVQNPP